MMDYTKYPANWTQISELIRLRAGNRCEGSPAYPDCRAANRQSHPVTGSTVFLTVAHLDHTTTNNDPANLRALCQRCHLKHDIKYHVAKAAITRRQHKIDAGQMEMWPAAPETTA